MPLNDPAEPIDFAQLDWSDLPPLNTDTLWAILNDQITDIQVNQILWYHLGYRYNVTENTWDISQVSPEWSQVYSQPPDFIGFRPATVQLTRSIPAEKKQWLKEKLGFKGYKVGEFGPRQTRRATAVSWLLTV
jgi:hypothetical protein